MALLSKPAVEFLRDVINDSVIYRSGQQLIEFFAQIDPAAKESYGPDFGSRKDYTERKLSAINESRQQLERCLSLALSEDSFVDLTLRDGLLGSLNDILVADGLVAAFSPDGVSLNPVTDEDRLKIRKDAAECAPECFRTVPVEPEADDAPIKKPFNPELIDISSDRQAVSNVVSMIGHGEIDLHPAFQRAGNIWNAKKQSRLIESLLLRIPLPAFYFDDDSRQSADGRNRRVWQVIDGLQRLCALNNFIVEGDGSPRQLRLTELEFLSRLEGRTFAELPHECQRTINETQLTTYLIRKGTPVNVKFNIFKRVNTGGVPLTQQEIRHALHQGPASEFLRSLAESREFQSATGGRIPTLRMLDREFINRFLAFYSQDHKDFNDLESFLDNALVKIEKETDEVRAEIQRVFCASMRVSKFLFDKYAFCKLDAYPRRKPINKVLFEVVAVTLAKLSDEQRDRLLKLNRDRLFDQYRQLFADDSYDGLTSLVSMATGSVRRIEQRYELMGKFFNSL